MAVPTEKIVSQSLTMRSLLETLSRRAPEMSPLFLVGPRGSGKRRLARWIHQHSTLSTSPLVVCQLGGEPDDVLREVFPGKLQQAVGNTLFVDELGDLPLFIQEQLYAFLQEHPCRLLVSSSLSLHELSLQQLLLPSLQHFLGEAEFVPSLRERAEDLPLLIAEFLHEAGLSGDAIAPAAKEALLAYSWPENVRELKRVLARALHASGGVKIKLDHLPKQLRS